ncbi:MAG: SGNH/GDSL hydrolase family protein [Candidatus Hodarchaeota archaeon]
MSSKFYKKYSIFEHIMIFLFLAVVGYLYIGFYYPDPNEWGLWSFAVTWGSRIIIPIVTFTILIAYHQIKTKQIELSHIGLLLGSTFFIILISYPIANFFYNRSMDMKNKLDQYHPYLQLVPKDFIIDEPFKKNQYLIICLGGSTTEFKDSTNIGWPERVEEILQRQYKTKNIRVYNQGRQWYTTLHTLINYQVNLRQYKPDVLIVMHAINDLLHNADFSYFSHGSFREDYGHFYGPVNRIIRRKGIEEFLWEKFKHSWYHNPRNIIGQNKFPGAVSFERNLNTLIDLVEKDSITIVLMTQPSVYREKPTEQIKSVLHMLNNEAIGSHSKWSYKSALNGFKIYNSIIRKIARDRGVFLIDLDMIVPKTLEYFSDDVHYKYPAFELIAKEVAKELININIIK